MHIHSCNSHNNLQEWLNSTINVHNLKDRVKLFLAWSMIFGKNGEHGGNATFWSHHLDEFNLIDLAITWIKSVDLQNLHKGLLQWMENLFIYCEEARSANFHFSLYCIFHCTIRSRAEKNLRDVKATKTRTYVLTLVSYCRILKDVSQQRSANAQQGTASSRVVSPVPHRCIVSTL